VAVIKSGSEKQAGIKPPPKGQQKNKKVKDEKSFAT
jgi:hypothetical protein